MNTNLVKFVSDKKMCEFTIAGMLHEIKRFSKNNVGFP